MCCAVVWLCTGIISATLAAMQIQYPRRPHGGAASDVVQSAQKINAVQVNRLVVNTGRQQGGTAADCFTFDSPRSPQSSRDSVTSSPIAAVHEELDAVGQDRDALQAENTARLWRCMRQTADINDLQTQLAASLDREAGAEHRAAAAEQRLAAGEAELAKQEAAVLQRAEAAERKLAKLVAENFNVAVVRCQPSL
jgi:hypothetical protein